MYFYAKAVIKTIEYHNKEYNVNEPCFNNYPRGWYGGLPGKKKVKLSRFQYLCLEICIKISKEKLSEAQKKRYRARLVEFLENGANLSALHLSFEDHFKNTALLEALSCECDKDEWLASTLIELAVKYNQTEILSKHNENGREHEGKKLWRYSSPLIFALKCGKSQKLILQLIKAIPERDRAKSLNMRDSEGRNALHYACLNGFDEVIETLINNGVNFDTQEEMPYCECYRYKHSNNHRRKQTQAYNKINDLMSDGGLFYTSCLRNNSRTKTVNEYIENILQVWARPPKLRENDISKILARKYPYPNGVYTGRVEIYAEKEKAYNKSEFPFQEVHAEITILGKKSWVPVFSNRDIAKQAKSGELKGENLQKHLYILNAALNAPRSKNLNQIVTKMFQSHAEKDSFNMKDQSTLGNHI